MRFCSATLFLLIAISCTGYAQDGTTPQCTYIDVNNVRMWTSTDGATAHNPNNKRIGFEFPKDSGMGLVFIEGLVFTGMTEGVLHAGGSTYRRGLQRGTITAPGVPADTSDLRYRIYKVRRMLFSEYSHLTAEMQSILRNDYEEWPVSDGAPWIDTDADGIYEPDFDSWLTGAPSGDYPDFDGDEVLWYVCNDLNAVRTNHLFGTDPVGLEIQTTVWAYDLPGVYGNTIFMKYLIINKGTQAFTDAYLGKWVDADIGYPFDDYVGVDTINQVAYTYNGRELDSIYSCSVPALGYVLLQGPVVPSPNDSALFKGKYRAGYQNLPMTTFTYYSNSGQYADPRLGDSFGALMLYRNMQGLLWNGIPYTDITTNTQTDIILTGDPITRIGWVDGLTIAPGDRIFLFATGPINLAVGDTTEMVVAISAARGTDNLNSITRLFQASGDLLSDWRLQQLVSDVPSTPLPGTMELHAAYPNPANNAPVTIGYAIAGNEYISLRVTNIFGQTVRTVSCGQVSAGSHSIQVDMSALPAGMYFYTLTGTSGSITKRFIMQ